MPAAALAVHRARKGVGNPGKPLGASQLKPHQADSSPQTVEGVVQTTPQLVRGMVGRMGRCPWGQSMGAGGWEARTEARGPGSC